MKTLPTLVLLFAFAAFVVSPVALVVIGPLLVAAGLLCILLCDYHATPDRMTGHEDKLISRHQSHAPTHG